MTQPSRPRTRTGPWIVIAVLLIATLVAVLWVPIYARTTPAIGGFPFFYWYQLLWVPIVAVVGAICYGLSRLASADSRRGTAPGGAAGGAPGSGEDAR